MCDIQQCNKRMHSDLYQMSDVDHFQPNKRILSLIRSLPPSFDSTAINIKFLLKKPFIGKH